MTPVRILDLMTHRFRWAFWGSAIYLLAAAAFAWIVKDRYIEYAPGFVLPPAFLALFMTMAAFSNPESDIASEASGYPAFLLRLPVRTSTLALAPVVGSILWTAGAWIFLAACVMRPMGLTVPIWWPALVVTSIATTLQAALWMPIRFGYARVFAAITLPVLMIYFAMAWPQAEVTERQLAMRFGGATIFFAALAIWAVARARSTSAVRRTVKERTFQDKARAWKPFKSAFAAQVWVEWRRTGRLLPFIVGGIILLMSLPLLRPYPHFSQLYFYGPIEVQPWVNGGAPILAFLPVIFATVLGMGASRSYLKGADGSYHLFFATRPLTDAQFLRAKTIAILFGALIAMVLPVIALWFWLQIPARTEAGEAPLLDIMRSRSLPEDKFYYAGYWLLLLILTIRNQTVGSFVEFIPKGYIRGVYALAVAISGATIWISLGVNGRWLSDQKNEGALFAIVGAFLALKLAVAGILAWRLIALRPETKSDLVRRFVVWLVAAGVVAYVAHVIGAGLSRQADYWFYGSPAVSLCAALLVPLTRPVLARLAIEAGRHKP